MLSLGLRLQFSVLITESSCYGYSCCWYCILCYTRGYCIRYGDPSRSQDEHLRSLSAALGAAKRLHKTLNSRGGGRGHELEGGPDLPGWVKFYTLYDTYIFTGLQYIKSLF